MNPGVTWDYIKPRLSHVLAMGELFKFSDPQGLKKIHYMGTKSPTKVKLNKTSHIVCLSECLAHI